MLYKLFDKEISGGAVKNKIMQKKKELPEESHEPIIRKLEKRKVHSSFRDNIWGADLGGFDFYYVLLIFIVKVYGLFL